MTKKTLAMLLAELVGTFVLALVALSINRYGLPIFTAASVGVAYAALFTAFSGVSGAHFNPAISLGMFTIRRIAIRKAVAYILAQAVGAVLAWKLYEWFIGKNLPLAATEFDWKVFTSEMVGMAIFGMAIAAVVYKGLRDHYASVTLGLGLFIGASIASLVAASGVLNPAMAIAMGYRPQNVAYVAYFFGPVIGAVVGMGLYSMFVDGNRETMSSAAVVVEEVAVVAVPSRTTRSTAKKPAKKPAARAKKPAARRK